MVSAVTVGPVNAGGGGGDPDREIEHLTVAGTFLTSRLDANDDGDGSSWCTSIIKGGHQGSSMMQCINESVFVGPTAECPGGLYVVNEVNGGTDVGTRTFPSAKDQIHVALTGRELCADALGGLTSVDSGVIVGGIGRYAGATGTYQWDYSGQIMYFDLSAAPPQFFGSIAGSGTWVIEFP